MRKTTISSLFFLIFLSACALSSPPGLPGDASATAPLPPSPQPGLLSPSSPSTTPTSLPSSTPIPPSSPTPTAHPLDVRGMRQRDYPGSDLLIEQTLQSGSNYSRFIVSYLSDGLKIYALLTVPFGERPSTGWPVIVFNHGYIPPASYRTTERYVAYVDAFARNGYIVLKPDYRGHGDSEGAATGGYSTPDYTIDVLNAVGSIQRFPETDPQRIGMWGHSMGGHITLRAMVTTRSIRAGVIWAGVVASYPDLLTRWRATPPATLSSGARSWRNSFIERFGAPEENPEFWASISPITYIAEISGPLQLHHGTADESVPVLFSELLYQAALEAGVPVEFYTYPQNDHNISQSFSVAMQRSIEFFDRHVKNAP